MSFIFTFGRSIFINTCPDIFFSRGCIFAAYEILTLKRLLSFDTQVVQQEKLKSYIYLQTVSLDPSEYQGKIHRFIDLIRNN